MKEDHMFKVGKTYEIVTRPPHLCNEPEVVHHHRFKCIGRSEKFITFFDEGMQKNKRIKAPADWYRDEYCWEHVTIARGLSDMYAFMEAE